MELFERAIESGVRALVREMGTDPPALRDIAVDRDGTTHTHRVGFRFQEGPSHWFAISNRLFGECRRPPGLEGIGRIAQAMYWRALEDERAQAHRFEMWATARNALYRNDLPVPARQAFLQEVVRYSSAVDQNHAAADALLYGFSSPRQTATEVATRQQARYQWGDWDQRPDVVAYPRGVFGTISETWRDRVVWFDDFFNDDVGTTEAQERGLQLLKDSLTPEQLAQYEENNWFEVTGSDTGKRYRIKHGRQMNIKQVNDEGREEKGYCFLPSGGLVAGDVMLAQKIMLECRESEALEVANVF